MHHIHRLAVVGFLAAAAVAVGSVALAAPASANDTMTPVALAATTGAATTGAATTGAATTGAATTVAQPVGTAALEAYTSGLETVQQSSATWKGGAARDLDTGTWRATITRGDVTILLGHYETEKEARKAARKEARELNGVMDGPGCDPPFVLC